MATKPTAEHTGSYETVNQILERLREVHLRVIQEMDCPGVTGEKEQFVRKSIAEQERQQLKGLENYRRDGDHGILDTWIQYIPLGEIEEILDGTQFPCDLPADEVLARKARLDAAILEFYRHLARETSVPRVEEIFKNLADHAEQRAKQQSWRFREE